MSPNSRAWRIRSATSRRFSVERQLDLLLQLLVALWSEEDFLHVDHHPEEKRNARAGSAVAGADCTGARGRRNP